MSKQEKQHKEVIDWSITFPKLLIYFSIFFIYIIGAMKITAYINNIPIELQLFFILGLLWAIVMISRVIGMPEIHTKYVEVKEKKFRFGEKNIIKRKL